MIETSSKLRQNFVKTLLIIIFSISNMQGMYFLGKETLKNTIVDAIVEAKVISRTVNNLSIWALIKIGFSKEKIVGRTTNTILSAILGIGSVALTGLFSYLITKKAIYNKIIQQSKNTFKDDIIKRKEYDVSLNNTQKDLVEEYQNKSVLFMGPQGTGKSTIMVNIGKNALEEGSNVYWIANEIFSYSNLSRYGLVIDDEAIFKSICEDAKQQALKNKKPSYILIDELHRSKIYNWQVFNTFLDYTNNTSFKEQVNVLATTVQDNIPQDAYRPGRLELKIIYREKDQDANEKFRAVEANYKKLQESALENQ